MSKRVGVLMGGPSPERDISVKSGKAVCSALKNTGVEVIPIELASTSNMNGYRQLVVQKIRSSRIDTAFIALHGKFGEDGTIQEILEEMGIPYTGSKVEASRLGMDKSASRRIFEARGIPIPEYRVIDKGKSRREHSAIFFKELGSPLVIKPSCSGSSIGLSIVDNATSFEEALGVAFRYSERIIIEEYIRGREITVGILGNESLPVVEIVPKKKFFDFEAKYKKGLTDYIVPAQIEKAKYEECQKIALLAHIALRGYFFSRVDMILSRDERPVVLEVNTIPGLTEMSLLPMAAMAAGIDFNKLVFKILESARW